MEYSCNDEFSIITCVARESFLLLKLAKIVSLLEILHILVPGTTADVELLIRSVVTYLFNAW